MEHEIELTLNIYNPKKGHMNKPKRIVGVRNFETDKHRNLLRVFTGAIGIGITQDFPLSAISNIEVKYTH